MDFYIKVKNEEPVTTSLEIAEKFGKQHKHVLRDIQNLEMPSKFRESNFGLSSYVDLQNKKQPMYYLTKNGFILLVMGYTGDKATDIKIGYIEAFDKMYDYIIQITQDPSIAATYKTQRKISKTSRRELTDVIRDILLPYLIENGYDKDPKWPYINYSQMLNKALLENPSFKIPKGKSKRDFIPANDLPFIIKTEQILADLIIDKVNKKVGANKIYRECKEKFDLFADMLVRKIQLDEKIPLINKLTSKKPTPLLKDKKKDDI